MSHLLLDTSFTDTNHNGDLVNVTKVEVVDYWLVEYKDLDGSSVEQYSPTTDSFIDKPDSLNIKVLLVESGRIRNISIYSGGGSLPMGYFSTLDVPTQDYLLSTFVTTRWAGVLNG